MSLLLLLESGFDPPVRSGGSYLVRVDWADDGFGAIGSTDDVSAYVRSIDIARGRDQDLQAFPAGQAQVQLVDNNGRFNPRNTSSPLSPNVLPMRGIKIEYLSDLTKVGIAWGNVVGQGYSPTWYPDAAALGSIVAMGCTSMRVDVPWNEVEGTAGNYDWSDTDEFMAFAASAGIGRVLLMVGYSPEWANGTAGTEKAPPVDPDDYGTFCGSVVARYCPCHGTNPYQGGAIEVEVWNEPNIQEFLAIQSGGDNRGSIYTAMLKSAYDGMKAVTDHVHIVSGGLAPRGNADSWPATDGTAGWNPVAFVENCYEEWEWGGYFDSLGHHPYESSAPLDIDDSQNAFRQMDTVYSQNLGYSLRSLMEAFGDGRKKMTLTEFGFDNSLMAGTLVDANWNTMADFLGTAHYVRGLYHYNWIDDSPSGGEFGLFDAGGTARAVQGSIETWLGTDDATIRYPLFTGFIERIAWDPPFQTDPGIASFACEDAFEHIGNYNPSVGTLANTYAGTAIQLVLDDGKPSLVGPSNRRIDTRATEIHNFACDADTRGLTEIESVLAVDLGVFYIDAGGTAVYETRTTRAFQSRQGVLDGQAQALEPTLDVHTIINQQRAGLENDPRGELSSSTDASSTAEYGVREGAALTSDLFPGIYATESYCDYIVDRFADPTGPIGPISFFQKGTDQSLTGIFHDFVERDVGDRVDLITTASQIGTLDAFIESIRHRIEPPNFHTWEIQLSEVQGALAEGTAPFRIGVSRIGSTDGLGY